MPRPRSVWRRAIEAHCRARSAHSRLTFQLQSRRKLSEERSRVLIRRPRTPKIHPSRNKKSGISDLTNPMVAQLQFAMTTVNWGSPRDAAAAFGISARSIRELYKPRHPPKRGRVSVL